MKECSKCTKEKLESEFYIITSKQRRAPYLNSICKDCVKEQNSARKFRKGYRERENQLNRLKREADPLWSNKEKLRMSDFNKRHPASSMYYNAKRRAKNKGIEFSIDITDIVIPKMCPYLEIVLIKGTKGKYENTPSLDRIDNSKGYTKDNILVVSKKGNSMKNSASPSELATFCKNISDIVINKDIVRANRNQ